MNGDLFGSPITIWDIARQWLGGDLLGKTIRDHGEEPTKQAVVDTLLKVPADPKSYLLGILKSTPEKIDRGTDTQPWMWTNERLMAECVRLEIPTRGKNRQDLINALRDAA